MAALVPLLVAPTLAVALGALVPPADDPPPARALSMELCRAPRLAGTPGSWHAVEFVSRVLEEAGFEVELDRREVLLSLPRSLEFAVLEDLRATVPVVERVARFDPDARPPGDVPPFSAWTASGAVTGEVVDAGWGTRADFERLVAARIDLAGKIALCRYGRGYRGVKVELAQEFGCAGVLLFTPAEDDGAPRGAVWPAGPWKPSHETQRGAVGPMAQGPGDPTTPGWPSPAPGADARRLAGAALDDALPRILVHPIGARDAEEILARLARRRVLGDDGERTSVPVGPGPVAVRLAIDAPRELRTIVNVVGTLPGRGGAFVMAGNHRDAWVRGARDAGSGTVSLLRAAQHLGERARAGWAPENGVRLAFWDAEESGLIGSTEWGEAGAEGLRARCIAYLNGDAVVGGLDLNVSGSPGLEAALLRALERVPEPVPSGVAPTGRTLAAAWRARFEGRASELPLPELPLPGSGSDFTVFLHHLGVPVLDLTLSGVGSGEYHTAFDDFLLIDRFVDPDWIGHETAGRVFAELLAEFADSGFAAFDDERAARELARHARDPESGLDGGLAAEIAASFEALADAIAAAEDAAAPARLLQALEHRPGLEGRPWFKNQLWAPGLEAGYGAETFPRLRAAADEAGRRAAADDLLARIATLRDAWLP